MTTHRPTSSALRGANGVSLEAASGWREVDALLRQAVAGGVAPGLAAVVVSEAGVVFEAEVGGVAAADSDEASGRTLFRFASMTKPLASAAALQLVEDGQLRLEQTVSSVVPEFAELQVLEGFTGETPLLRPPVRQPTIRELLNHTSGLGYFFTNADLLRYHELTGLSTEDGVLESLRAPLVADPGTRWEYGVSSDYVGLVVEAVSGQDLDSFLLSRLFEPLGMADTTFNPSAEQRARLMPVHYRDDEGALSPGDDILALDPEFWSGGGGAYGTARDYGRFIAALLNGGTLDGVRVLSPESVELMFTDSLQGIPMPAGIPSADPELTNDVPFPAVRHSFSLGLNVILEDLPGGRRAGTGGWDGIFNTHFWVDRTAGLAGTLLTQILPYNDAAVGRLLEEFEGHVYSAMGT